MELLIEAEIVRADRPADLLRETAELNAILTASVKTVKARLR